MNYFYLVPAASIVALIFAYYFFKKMMKESEGTEKMKTIAQYVRDGAMSYLKQQYKVVVVVFVILAFLFAGMAYFGLQNNWVPFAFLTGGFFSALAGFFGMKTATYASARTANAVRRSLNSGLQIAFRSGAVMGLVVVGLALLDISLWYLILDHFVAEADAGHKLVMITTTMLTFGMGASTQALFARVGGGIFTKGADVGGDLVGKVEAGIPEDDPRNPATIADNVGDNVGDCAGMAADLFETYAVTVVATMVLAAIFFLGQPNLMSLMVYPLAIGAACLITSIIGTFFVKLGANNSIMGALYRGFIASAVLSVVGLFIATQYVLGSWGEVGTAIGLSITGTDLFFCGIVGLAVTGAIVWITEYYTGIGYRPVRSISQASVTGHGTNVIQGLAVSLEATALPTLVIVAGIIVTYNLAGLFGTAIATTTMLGLAGMVVALDEIGRAHV